MLNQPNKICHCADWKSKSIRIAFYAELLNFVCCPWCGIVLKKDIYGHKENGIKQNQHQDKI